MTEVSASPLLVELFLTNGRIRGVTHEVRGRKRLLDVLTDGGAALRLESANVLFASTSGARELGSLNIEKRSIVAAIPHETPQQLRERSMLTSTVGKHQTHQLHAVLLLPPFIAEGSIHLPSSVGGIGAKLTADAQIFASFVSVTGAKLSLPGGSEIESPVLLVNRDLIAGISVVDERRSFGDQLPKPG
jgi:hypothetical protein